MTFRPARPARSAWNLAKTGLQIVLFWGLFLAVVPAAIVALEGRVGIAGFTVAGQRSLAAVLFVACSGLGLASGFTMAVAGRGTPLPLDCPRRLVVRGPYAFVRNPMAVAGLGQGAAVGLWLGSWSILAYVLLGGVLWDVLVRPVEEADLAGRFGGEFDTYCRTVRCWWPRRRPYRPPPGPGGPEAV